MGEYGTEPQSGIKGEDKKEDILLTQRHTKHIDNIQ